MNKVVDLVKKVVDLVDNTKIYSILKATDLSYASQLSNITKNNIYFKREDQIPMHSFKLRGAHQKISRLSKEQIAKGIIASSAGNHAQGVAFSAKKLGINATIVMPFSAAQIKVKSVKSLGANVILHGSSFAEALEHAKKIEKERDLVFVHAFDDIEVVSGQATIGKELIEQLPEVDKIFIPVGGGGLISGIASYVKYHKPKVKIIGVEPEDCSTLYTSLEKKKRLALKEIGSFADGVAVSQIGEDAYEIAKELVEEVILVNNDEICAAVKYIYEDIRSISEPSGALSTAGMRKYINQHNIKNENLVSIISGSNVNFDL
jgi:threonine dehydratase